MLVRPLVLCALFCCAIGCGPAVDIRGVLDTSDGGTTIIGLSADGGIDTPPPPPRDYASLSEIQTKIFQPHCAGAACHAAPSPAFDLDLTEPTSMLADRLRKTSKQSLAGIPLIKAGAYGSSYLYLKVFLETPVVGDRMPPAARLDPELIDGLKGWIQAGAP